MANYFIIGGNSGIGFSIGKQLLAQGHEIHQASRQRGALAEIGAQWQEFQLGKENDLAMPEDLSGLVYCPGSIRLKPFHRIKAEEFYEDLEVNALGAVRVLQAAQSSLQAGEGGSVLLFSSVAAQVGLGFHASIAMAKAAVEGLTRSLAAEWTPKVRVNAIAPALTHTPLGENLLNTEAKQKAAASRHPLQRVGQSSEIAALGLYLLGETGKFSTGQVFHIDGGISGVRV